MTRTKMFTLSRYLTAAAFLGFAATAGAAPIALTLSGPIPGKDTTNPEDIQCIIYGNSCPGGQQEMSALNYAQGGNVSAFDLTSNPNDKGSGETQVVNPYTVGYLAGFVGKVFDIGIDINTADHQETLQAFDVLVGGVLAFSYLGPDALLDPINNGNGFFDFLLSTVDLSAYADSAVVVFRAAWSGASDGAENFFVVRRTTQVPEPATTALLIVGGLAMLGIGRRRRQS